MAGSVDERNGTKAAGEWYRDKERRGWDEEEQSPQENRKTELACGGLRKSDLNLSLRQVTPGKC